MILHNKRSVHHPVHDSHFRPIYTEGSWAHNIRYWIQHGTTHTPKGRGILVHLIGHYLHRISQHEQSLLEKTHHHDQKLSQLEKHHGRDKAQDGPHFRPIFSEAEWSNSTKHWIHSGDVHNLHDNLPEIMLHYIQMIVYYDEVIDQKIQYNEIRLNHLMFMIPHDLLQNLPQRKEDHDSKTTLPLQSIFSSEKWFTDAKHLLQDSDTTTPQARRGLLKTMLEPYLKVISLRAKHFDDITKYHEKCINILIRNHQIHGSHSKTLHNRTDRSHPAWHSSAKPLHHMRPLGVYANGDTSV